MRKIWFLLAFILSGCAYSKITSSWKNPTAVQSPADPVMVVGIMKYEDSSLCRKMEQRFAEELSKLGYNAISAQAVYGPNAYKDLNEEETFKLVYKRGIGAVITIELLDKVKEVYQQPLWSFNNSRWNYHTAMPEKVYNPDSYIILTDYLWQSNFYDMDGFLLLYSVQSTSSEPGSEKSFAVTYVQMILNDMVRNGMLQKHVRALKAF
ncbi:MAG: hypothetical protein ABI480_08455 [Chitinophagaceae bacterium]